MLKYTIKVQINNANIHVFVYFVYKVIAELTKTIHHPVFFFLLSIFAIYFFHKQWQCDIKQNEVIMVVAKKKIIIIKKDVCL